MTAISRGFPRHIALPREHGAWILFLSPLIIGLALAPQWTPGTSVLILTAVAAFLIREPASVLVKIWAGRRSRADLAPALRYFALYGLVVVLGLVALVRMGYGFVLHLAVPGLLVFAWHMYLVYRRQERRQLGAEVVGVGVLSLTAPALVWISHGKYEPYYWWLWLLIWLQEAASVVFAFLRLEQRTWRTLPPLSERLRAGAQAMAYATFNLLFVVLMGVLGYLSPWLWLAYVPQWVENIWGTLRPAIRWSAIHIGLRQTAVTVLFTVLFILTWGR